MTGPKTPKAIPGGRQTAKAVFRTATDEGRNNLLETESMELLQAYGIKVPEARLARDPKEAASHAEEIGWPVAMKVVSPDILHKSDTGGVKLGLENSHQVERAFEEIVKSAQKVTRRSRVLGTLISPM
nr:CoA-binding protein [Pseudomonadota bacterium]